MAENTAIEWADHTFNGWTGCEAISPGCRGCYAEAWAKRAGRDFAVRVHTKTWGDPLKWQRAHAAFFAEHGRRQRVFCHSLADWLDNKAPIEWLVELLDLIRTTPELDWLLLSKRIGNWRKRLEEARGKATGWLRDWIIEWLGGKPPANVWIGATVVDQAEADRDVPKLLAVPARVRFLSIEPMLGPINLYRIALAEGLDLCALRGLERPHEAAAYRTPLGRIDWIIAGGESGPGARPMHPDWARSLRDQCAEAGVPFLFKQWGEWTPGENVDRQRGTVDTAFWWDDHWSIHALNLATDHGHIDDQPDLYRVGKKAAGRQLDGRTHDGFPL